MLELALSALANMFSAFPVMIFMIFLQLLTILNKCYLLKEAISLLVLVELDSFLIWLTIFSQMAFRFLGERVLKDVISLSISLKISLSREVMISIDPTINL
jgi:hypothetical protein